jgi:outer membrane lipoprotein
MICTSSCAPVVSKKLRAQVDKETTFDDVIEDPSSHQGKLVIWAGVIIGAKNEKEGTIIEILHKPADIQGRPKDVDESGGRFLAVYDGYLDVAVYRQDREVTIAGVIQTGRVLPLGNIEYAYPVISVKEIHLWPRRSNQRVYLIYPYWYYPGWWHEQYWDTW